MTKRSYGAPLEQSCISPGHWLIEGYNADRLRGRRGGWEVWKGSRKVVEHLPTLDHVRDYIRQETNR